MPKIENLRHLVFLVQEAERRATTERPILALDMIRAIYVELDRLERLLVVEARSAGYTWFRVGDALGISRQGAADRFRPVPEPEPLPLPAPLRVNVQRQQPKRKNRK